MKKRTIDYASIIGIIAAIGLIIFGIMVETDPSSKAITGFDHLPLKNFFDIPSIFIVVGGVFGTLLLMFPLSQFAKIPKHIMIIFAPNAYLPDKYIETIVESAEKARMSGLLSLEEDASGMTDTFLKNSIRMIVDSVDPENVKIQMESWMDSIDGRHAQECEFYEKASALAPGFGMIGTLIGLINMMQSLEDIETVGPNMAVALVTTLYGSILSTVIFSPIANKLRVRHEEEYLCMMIVSEGVQAIQAGENPRLIKERLLHMLPEYKQMKLRKDKDDGDDEKSGKAKKKPKKEKTKKVKKEKTTNKA